MSAGVRNMFFSTACSSMYSSVTDSVSMIGVDLGGRRIIKKKKEAMMETVLMLLELFIGTLAIVKVISIVRSINKTSSKEDINPVL